MVVYILEALYYHVEDFASQKLDLAIQVREANDGGQLEIAGTVDVIHNDATGTDKAGVRVIKFSEDGTYDGFRVYVRTCRYSQLTLRLTQQGSVTFNTSHGSPATSEPSPVSGGHVEIDTSTLTPGHHIIVDSAAKATIADSSGNASFTGHVSATQFRPTNIVTNKVVKFNGTQLDDSIITDDGSTVTVTGNLTITGTTTTLNTQTVEVKDNILQLNTTQGSPDTATATTSGISVYRGNGVTQASFIFDDGDDTWDLTNNLNVASHISTTAGGFSTSANLNSTGDKGLAIHSGARLGFDQSGTRSWSIKADGGNLNVFSGDGNGGLNVSLADGVITNAIKTRSGDLDIYTVLTSRDMRFRSGNNNVQLRVKGDNSGIQIHDIASLRAASVTSATTTTTVSSIPIATYTAAFFDYSIKNGTNVRAGTVVATHDGTNVEFNETSTVDLGDTSDVTLSVDISSGDMRLRATTTSSTWTIKALIRGI